MVRRIGILGLLLIQCALLAGAASAWWAYRHNTLFAYGRWISGKDTGKFVFYSYDFLFQPIKNSSVNLTGNMGFQEILYAKKERPNRALDRLRAEMHIDAGAYVWIELRKENMRLLGCRLSRNGNYPSGFYLFNEHGHMVEHTPFAAGPPDLQEHWNRVDLRRDDGQWTLYLNGIQYGQVADPPLQGGYVGFRGSGSTQGQVLLKSATMTWHDPEYPSRTWSHHHKFTSRRVARKVYGLAFLFAVLVLGARRWRDDILAGFLAPERRALFKHIEAVSLTVLLVILLLIPPHRTGLQFSIWVLVAELVSLITLAGLRRGAPAPAYQRPIHAGWLYGLTLLVVSGLAFALNDEALGRPRDLSAVRMAGYHPNAFLLQPADTHSAAPSEATRPVTVAPGAPWWAAAGAYREQTITAEVVMPTNSTLDVVFQQQSYKTLGDPQGESLPLQRHLLRLTTREDVPMGLALRTGNRPAPFLRIKGTVLPDQPNQLEIRSDQDGICVILNGQKTRVAQLKPLGFGETGFMAYDAPVTLRWARVEATRSESMRESALRWGGAVWPILAALAFWLLMRTGARTNLRDAFALQWAALYPLLFYLAIALWLGRDDLDYLVRERQLWLDGALLGSAVALLTPLGLWGGRRAALRFNVAALLVVLALAALAWDLLPDNSNIKLKFAQDAVAPGDIISDHRGKERPWYTSNRTIGANTYPWHQQFGGNSIVMPKPTGEIRVFIMGGSQAWGSGAASSAETFGELLEWHCARKGLPAKMYNAAVNGAGLTKVLEYYRQLVRNFAPDILIADLGLNDSAALRQIRSPERRDEHAQALLAGFQELLELCREDAVDVVLCLEPMCVELPLRPHSDLYEGLEALAREYGATLVKPMSITRTKEKDHLVWWDTAHFAPYGHHLLANLLEPAVEPLVRRRVDAAIAQTPAD
ncbi:MAG: SGNH/GDSL hydrolase family protein [Lentisphaerae bacterium]|nr:SGNH/GDSL hydrolase family protein [Lentisphaerota bacterium]